MKFFIDTAMVDEIRDANAMGMVDGVTTNPTLISKTGRPFKEVLTEICATVDGPISAEVAATDYDGMLAEAKVLLGIAKNIVIKAPMTWDGLRACRALSNDGHKVNVTLCFSANQALLAAKAGATFVSPFIGRLDDIGADGAFADLLDEAAHHVEGDVGFQQRPAHLAQRRRNIGLGQRATPGQRVEDAGKAI